MKNIKLCNKVKQMVGDVARKPEFKIPFYDEFNYVEDDCNKIQFDGNTFYINMEQIEQTSDDEIRYFIYKHLKLFEKGIPVANIYNNKESLHYNELQFAEKWPSITEMVYNEYSSPWLKVEKIHENHKNLIAKFKSKNQTSCHVFSKNENEFVAMSMYDEDVENILQEYFENRLTEILTKEYKMKLSNFILAAKIEGYEIEKKAFLFSYHKSCFRMLYKLERANHFLMLDFNLDCDGDVVNSFTSIYYKFNSEQNETHEYFKLEEAIDKINSIFMSI